MIEQLADISGKNRGVTLPASADTDQLFYAVLDKAVMITQRLRPQGRFLEEGV